VNGPTIRGWAACDRERVAVPGGSAYGPNSDFDLARTDGSVDWTRGRSKTTVDVREMHVDWSADDLGSVDPRHFTTSRYYNRVLVFPEEVTRDRGAVGWAARPPQATIPADLDQLDAGGSVIHHDDD
jgi:hypothetical protein